jgi:hypothetical protein
VELHALAPGDGAGERRLAVSRRTHQAAPISRLLVAKPVDLCLTWWIPMSTPPKCVTVRGGINIWEIDAYDPPNDVEFSVDNYWFSGRAAVCTFSREEMLATKLRASLERNKGQDLYDLADSVEVFEGLNTRRVVECLEIRLQKAGLRISRAEAQKRMFAKLRKTWPPDRSPSVAVNRGSEVADGTNDQEHVCQGLLRTGRSIAERPVGQDRGHERASGDSVNLSDEGADGNRQDYSSVLVALLRIVQVQ